jgi:transcriptional regulator with XRE-family HTH domain
VHRCPWAGGALWALRLREIRKAKGLSLRQLAAQLGKDFAHLSKVERGLETITLRELERIANLLNVPICELVKETHDV